MKRLALVMVAVLAGCGGPVSLRVKSKLVKALPVESRIDLLDSENALFAAIDNVDETRDALETAEADYDAAGDRIGEAKDQRKKAHEAKDSGAQDVAELAIVEAEQRKNYLKVQLKVLRKDLELAEAELDVARGRNELSKAEAVKKAALDGSQKLKVEEFEAQVAKLEERVKAMHDKADALRQEADTQKQTWTDSRAALAKASGGAQGSAWVE
jgi:chromosome segregation ATPase